MMKVLRFLQQYDTTVVVAALIAVGFAITWTTIGPGAALRGFAAELAILAVIFYIARQYLPWEDAPKERIKRPKTELLVGLAAYFIWLAAALQLFRGDDPTYLLIAGILLPVGMLLYGRYSSRTWGLRVPQVRDAIVLAVIVALVYGLSRVLGGVLPASEVAPTSAVLRTFTFGGSLPAAFIVAAVLQELLFRVYLQPRLAAYLPGRWAMFVQAVLYSAAYLPLYLIGSEYPLPYSLALAMVLSNGIMSGYFWRKTGNLPLLILLHLFAFPRYGL